MVRSPARVLMLSAALTLKGGTTPKTGNVTGPKLILARTTYSTAGFVRAKAFGAPGRLDHTGTVGSIFGRGRRATWSRWQPQCQRRFLAKNAWKLSGSQLVKLRAARSNQRFDNCRPRFWR